MRIPVDFLALIAIFGVLIIASAVFGPIWLTVLLAVCAAIRILLEPDDGAHSGKGRYPGDSP